MDLEQPLGPARPPFFLLLRVVGVLAVISGLLTHARFSPKAAPLDAAQGQRLAAKIAQRAADRTDDFRRATPDEFHPQGSAASRVRLADGAVVKTPAANQYLAYRPIEREACVLRRLRRFSNAFPLLLDRTKTTIATSFVGNRVTADTLPPDYREQYERILADLTAARVKHNDVMYPCDGSAPPVKWEVTVRPDDGRLSLVDFGWATIDDNVPCLASPFKFPPGWTPCPDDAFLKVMDGMARDRAEAREGASSAAAAGVDATRGARRGRRAQRRSEG